MKVNIYDILLSVRVSRGKCSSKSVEIIINENDD